MRKEFEGRTEFSQTEIDRWFDYAKPQEIENGVLWINEPHHFEDVYCYLILGKDRDLLIDTGMGVKLLKDLLSKLRGPSKELLVVNTHSHFDHIGGNCEFDQVLVPSNKDEFKSYKRGWNQKRLNKYDFADSFINIPSNFDPHEFCLKKMTNVVPVLQGGLSLNLGDRQIEVIDTPGHTPGSVSFFDRNNGLLFTGDFLYEGPLYAFENESDPKKYLDSLNKLSNLPIKTIHPGHNHSSNIDYPNLINEAISIFNRINSGEIPDHGGSVPGTVEYLLQDNGLNRRLMVIINNKYKNKL